VCAKPQKREDICGFSSLLFLLSQGGVGGLLSGPNPLRKAFSFIDLMKIGFSLYFQGGVSRDDLDVTTVLYGVTSRSMSNISGSTTQYLT
jgi:hypothetical protein